MNKFKRFNILLIFIISVLSLLIALFGDIERTLYKYLIIFSIIPVMLLPYIINKFTKFKLNEIIITLFLSFIFLAHFLGTIVNLYYKIPIYDKLVHTLSGIITSFLALILLVKFKKYNTKSLTFNVIYILSITSMIALSWEMFEFICDRLFNKDAQRVLLTGIKDTMLDMMVAFLGSCIFCVWYSYEEKLKKNSLIKKFIKQIN